MWNRAETQRKVKEWKLERAAEQLAQKKAEVAVKMTVSKQESQQQLIKLQKRQQAKVYREEKVDKGVQISRSKKPRISLKRLDVQTERRLHPYI